MTVFSLSAATALTACLLAAGARANTNNNEPGSLLVFPIFDNTSGSTIISVVNTNSDFTSVGNQFAGTVKVEFVYVNSLNCQEFNRTRTLTPNDEITLSSSLDNPGMQKGYLYVFAKSFATGQAIKFDWLIGTEWQLAGVQGDAFEVGPYVYKAGMRIPPGGTTDLDNDGIRDLNGAEYEQSPDHILVPRFFGQVPGAVNTDLVLINLTGGAQFFATVNFLVYNDNEEIYSAQHFFQCWTRVPLANISGVFTNGFLLSSGYAPGESTGIVVNNSALKTGWYRIDGGAAQSSATSFSDPAILALQIQSFGTTGYSADLPFTTGSQSNGDLLPHGVQGDSN